MKKIVSLSVLFLVVLMAIIPASAKTVTIDSVNVTNTAVTVNYNADSLTDGAQVTILTYKADSSDAEPTEANIKYIDQITKSSNTSLNFNFNDTPNGTYQIKMGGTDVESPDVISITITDKASTGMNFLNNSFKMFSKKFKSPDSIIDQNGKLVILKPENNYIAAFSDVPNLDGYEIDSYGIILNGNEYTANITTTNTNNFGVLFHGNGIKDEFSVVAYPYITYKKDGNTVTFYGTTIVDTLVFNAE